jgi:hypothetical protein
MLADLKHGHPVEICDCIGHAAEFHYPDRARRARHMATLYPNKKYVKTDMNASKNAVCAGTGSAQPIFDRQPVYPREFPLIVGDDPHSKGGSDAT